MGKRIAICGMLTALAMIFSYVEALIPLPVPIPGVRLGLANMVVVTGLYHMKWKDVLTISVLRIVLTGFMFGNMISVLYSLAGGITSFIVMLLLKRIKGLSVTGVSAAGGAAHNAGQIMAAVCIVKQPYVLTWLPVLLVSGVLTGSLVGILSKRFYVMKYVENN